MKIYAGFWSRAIAFALDYLIILVYMAGVAFIAWLVNTLLGSIEWIFAERIRAQIIGFFIVTLPVTLYFAISEASTQRATWGKAKMAVQVLDVEGERISLWRSLPRTMMKFIPWEFSHTLIWEIYFSSGKPPAWVNHGFTVVYALIGLNVASLIITSKRQTLYDMIAKTYVVRRAQ